MAKSRREFHGVPAASREWAFVIAAGTGNVKAMKSLLADGVNINAQPDRSSGATALHEAVRRGSSGARRC
jgi:hypothetical protein